MPDGATSIQPPPPTTMPPGKAAEAYVKLRDKVEEITKAHKAQLQPFTEMMAKLEGLLLAHLDTTGLDSIKVKDGGKGVTVFKATTTSVTVKEWEKTLDFIKGNELWDLLEARVAKTAAQEYMEETKAAIPGVTVTSAIALRVRRS